MITLEESEKRLRLLKKAREQLADNLRKSHEIAFSNWQSQCEEAWNKDKKLLPYVVQSFYPTEAEIVAKAVELYNATMVSEDEEPTVVEPEIESIDDFVKEEKVVPIDALIKTKNKKDT